MADNRSAFINIIPVQASCGTRTSSFTPSVSGRADKPRQSGRHVVKRSPRVTTPTAVLSEKPSDHTASPHFHGPLPNSSVFNVNPDLLETDSEENLRGFVKTRGSLVPGQEFVFWWVGDIYDLIDDQPTKHLFSFEGYNIGRMVRVDGGWRLLTREVGLYKHPRTGRILDVWQNPYTGAANQCIHVWNDPVNQQFLLNGPRGSFKVPTTTYEDDVYWHAEVFLNYKSPLPRSDFPENVGSDTYQSAEMFQFFSTKQQLRSDQPSADCVISWVRVGQWLPWMEMGDRPGRLVYHCRGRKLANGFEDLPNHVQSYILGNKPEYSSAPTNFTTPNETSWTYMRKLLANHGTPRADGRIARPATAELQLTRGDAKVEQAPKEMSREQLRRYDGRDASLPVLLAVDGQVFDVSSAKRHYGPGETYHCLIGRDASWALVSGDLSEKALRDCDAHLKDRLDKKQLSDLKHWAEFFAKNYPRVSTLVD
ncbi:Cytochrome b5-like Heme/Steroid binding [Gracilaria domingensis]|nr:Cytochrome b5-like Heme/Steroid binding [Gracilaria domingensis]